MPSCHQLVTGNQSKIRVSGDELPTCHRTCHPTCHRFKALSILGLSVLGDKVTSVICYLTCERECVLAQKHKKYISYMAATENAVTLSPCHREGAADA